MDYFLLNIFPILFVIGAVISIIWEIWEYLDRRRHPHKYVYDPYLGWMKRLDPEKRIRILKQLRGMDEEHSD